MFIRYIREHTEIEGVRGKPVGIVVALSKDKIGWSLCHKRDMWNKKQGFLIAIQRAKTGVAATKLKNRLNVDNEFYSLKLAIQYPRLAIVGKVVMLVEEVVKNYDFNKEK